MKSRYFEPNQHLFQIVLQDFRHRSPANLKQCYVDKSGRGIKEVVEHIPLLTLFRRAKNAKRAMALVRSKGTVISCHKVDSHLRKLEMISHLRLEKPIFVDISVEDFTVGRELQIEPERKIREISVIGNIE